MTTELVLLLAIFAFVTAKIFFGDHGPMKTFEKSGPRLGARLEQQLSTGRAFNNAQGSMQQWEIPNTAAPNGKLR